MMIVLSDEWMDLRIKCRPNREAYINEGKWNNKLFLTSLAKAKELYHTLLCALYVELVMESRPIVRCSALVRWRVFLTTWCEIFLTHLIAWDAFISLSQTRRQRPGFLPSFLLCSRPSFYLLGNVTARYICTRCMMCDVRCTGYLRVTWAYLGIGWAARYLANLTIPSPESRPTFLT